MNETKSKAKKLDLRESETAADYFSSSQLTFSQDASKQYRLNKRHEVHCASLKECYILTCGLKRSEYFFNYIVSLGVYQQTSFERRTHPEKLENQ